MSIAVRLDLIQGYLFVEWLFTCDPRDPREQSALRGSTSNDSWLILLRLKSERDMFVMIPDGSDQPTHPISYDDGTMAD
jgi:hypothetical protein